MDGERTQCISDSLAKFREIYKLRKKDDCGNVSKSHGRIHKNKIFVFAICGS